MNFQKWLKGMRKTTGSSPRFSIPDSRVSSPGAPGSSIVYLLTAQQSMVLDSTFLFVRSSEKYVDPAEAEGVVWPRLSVYGVLL